MLITDQTTLEEFCASVSASDFLTVDTEFLREKTYYPKLCLVQIGDPNGNAAAIDPLADGIDLSPVFELLFNKNILKIFHAARQDLEIFYNLTGKVVHPFFDTQIAAMVCGYGDSIGYESLVRNITGGSLDKSSQYTNWSNRPLSDKQIHYALGDVTYLVDIYQHLSKELDQHGRTEWVFEEEAILEDPTTYELDPFEMWRKVKVKSPKPKVLAILQALAAWREKRAQHKNLPRSWVLRDETLADMAAQAPQDEKALKKIRNFPADLANHKIGQEVLETIKTVLDSDAKHWPRVEKRKPPSAEVAAKMEILRMLLKLQSAEHGVAGKLIAQTQDLEVLAQEAENADISALSGWRRKVFGEEALAMIAGKLAIGLQDGKITKIAL